MALGVECARPPDEVGARRAGAQGFAEQGTSAMAMVCPQCNQSFDQQLQCPACGVRLLYHAKIRPSGEEVSGPDGQWQHTPWGRIVVGVIVAQGLAYGLQLLLTAGFQATGEAGGQTTWNTPAHQLVLQGLNGFALLVGGLLTGAGRRRGVYFGSIVGLVHALIFLIVQQCKGGAITEVMLSSVPVLHMAFGGAGGLIGGLIWKPLPAVHMPRSGSDTKSDAPRSLRGESTILAGPVAWLRVLAGGAMVVAGVVWAPAILNVALTASNEFAAFITAQYRLSITSPAQYHLVTWQMAAFITFLAAGFAGATTRNGFKQGLCVGLGAGLCLAGLQLAKQNPDVDRAILTAVGALLLSVGGGWFGGQLFPPIRVVPRRKVPHYLSEAG